MKRYKMIVFFDFFSGFNSNMSIGSFDQIEPTCPNQDYEQVVSILMRKKNDLKWKKHI